MGTIWNDAVSAWGSGSLATVNGPVSKSSRGDKTAIELFRRALARWPGSMRASLAN